MNNRIHYAATVLKFARDALTDARSKGQPQQEAEARAEFERASRVHANAWAEHRRDVGVPT